MTFVKSRPDERQILEWLSRVDIFDELTAQALTPLIKRAKYVSFVRGEVIEHEGAVLCAVPLVAEGQIEVLRHTWQAEEKIFGIFSAGELVAIAAVFMPHNRFPMTLRAKTDGAALMLKKSSLMQVCEQNPVVMRRLLTRFSLKLYEHVNFIDWLTSSSAQQRLALYILHQSGRQTSFFSLPLSRGQLATRLGVRYETLSRLLSHWRSQKIVEVKGNQFRLLKPEYLEELTRASQRAF